MMKDPITNLRDFIKSLGLLASRPLDFLFRNIITEKPDDAKTDMDVMSLLFWEEVGKLPAGSMLKKLQDLRLHDGYSLMDSDMEGLVVMRGLVVSKEFDAVYFAQAVDPEKFLYNYAVRREIVLLIEYQLKQYVTNKQRKG